ncbi:MAG: hypothetical protein AB7W59_17990 [Acidimicrobiia bacterium]
MDQSNPDPSSHSGPSIALPDLELEFVGERHRVSDGRFFIGSRADLNLDVATAVPGRLLELWAANGLWMLRQLEPEPLVVVRSGGFEARVGAGAVPLVFGTHCISITARSTYEVEARVSQPLFVPRLVVDDQPRIIDDEPRLIPTGMEGIGEVAAGPTIDVGLNREQRILLTVLAAPVLRGGPVALSEIPSSVEAARLLGWPVTKFNRKLDTVCGKLARAGIGGLHGGANRPALNRRTRLVQVVVESGVVSVADLALLQEFAPLD